MSRFFILLIACFSLYTGAANARETEVPKTDLKGLTDPPGLARYAGSVLIYRDDVAYDEVKFPMSRTVTTELKTSATRSLERSGQRSAALYITPAGRTALELVRNYQQALKPGGFETVFECAGEACGMDRGHIGLYDFPVLVMPSTYWNFIDEATPAACAGGAFVGEFRYALLDNKTTGALVAVMAWKPGDSSVYCAEAEFKKRSTVAIIKVEPKAREQNVETLSATDLSASLTATGKVAVYGILFDTNKADLKPESKASLDQIATLLKQQATTKLHVVGHTDNVGALPANIDLSKRRADAVAAALSKDYAIARDRLTANGVGSLAPVASNASDAGKAKNRRVELVLQ